MSHAPGQFPVPHSPDTPLGRFGITTLLDSPDPFIASMPMSNLLNPLTRAASIGPLTVLVDFVAGLVNHHRRTADEWTVSTALTLEVVPNCGALLASAPHVPVVASAHPLGAKGSTSHARCEMTHDGVVLGIGTVRSTHVDVPAHFPGDAVRSKATTRPAALIDIMALRVDANSGPEPILWQPSTPYLDNSMGMVHGGVAATGLELVGSAALNAHRTDSPLFTTSVHVNYLRPFFSGAHSHYVARTVYAGRRSGVAEARAVSEDGRTALVAHVSAHN